MFLIDKKTLRLLLLIYFYDLHRKGTKIFTISDIKLFLNKKNIIFNNNTLYALLNEFKNFGLIEKKNIEGSSKMIINIKNFKINDLILEFKIKKIKKL